MVVKPIRNDVDHAAALPRIEELWDAPEDSEESDELEVLAILVSVYEDARWPIDAPDAVERNGAAQSLGLGSRSVHWSARACLRRPKPPSPPLPHDDPTASQGARHSRGSSCPAGAAGPRDGRIM